MDLLALADLLSAHDVTATPEGAGLDAFTGSGLQRRSARLETGPVLTALTAMTPRAATAAGHAWARGVAGVLCEPARSRGAEMSWRDATSRVLPRLELPMFDVGVRDAGGDAPFAGAGLGPFVVRYVLELDVGQRVVTKAQVDSWGVHPERVEKAAVSLLFHRTRFGDLAPTADHADVDAFDVGDGLDAARLTILDAWDYPRCRAGARVAAPTPGTLLVSRSLTEPDADAFAALVAARHADADEPLSDAVLRFVDGTLVAPG